MKPKLQKIRKPGPKKRKQRRMGRPLFSPEDVGRTINLPLSWLTGNADDDVLDDETPRGTYTITAVESRTNVVILRHTPTAEPFLSAPHVVAERVDLDYE